MDCLFDIVMDILSWIGDKLDKNGRPEWMKWIVAIAMVAVMLLYFGYGAYCGWQDGNTIRRNWNILAFVLVIAAMGRIAWRHRNDKKEE